MPELSHTLMLHLHHAKTKLVLYVLFIFCFLFHQGAISQCTITVASPIPDNDTITLGFAISGLISSNLPSAAQGICGIDISFDHEYVGDLTITLISPAGTQVQLIGAPTTAILPTNLTTWDIHFVPCGSAANPDAGFQDMWSNDQPWQALTTYNGIYYPALGCLEDFNVGSANGQWLLVIQDHELNQIGNLLTATLTFCNTTGLSCSACLPNAGILSPSSIVRCEGENIQSSEVSIDFGSNHPSSLLYGYRFLLVSGGVIIQNGTAFSATLPGGNYSLCGLSYLLDDSTAVNTLLNAGDLFGLIQDINSGVLCGDTSNCIPIQVLVPPDTMNVNGSLCQGETFTFGGQSYNTTGTFYQVHDGPSMCDTIFEIHLLPRLLNVVINDPDTLFCNNPIVTLNAVAAGASGPFTYTWTSNFGNIISPPNLPSVDVDQSGDYSVVVTDGLCSGSANTDVIADLGFPQVFVVGGTITCTQTSINLDPIFIPSDAAIQWTGPMGFMSIVPNIVVTEPGSYFLKVTNNSGCSTTREVLVGIDTITFVPQILVIEYNCSAPYVILTYTSPLNAVGHDWTGPNGFTSNSTRPQIVDAGQYVFTATFDNGCQRQNVFNFNGDFAIPDITVPANDTLNCSESISLTASSTTPGASISWQGPNNFFAAQATILVDQIGIYQANVVAPNGCSNAGTVEIVRGADVFDYTVFYDTLTCALDTVFIGVISPQADLYQWINYTGSDVDQPIIRIGSPGTYSVMMTDTNSLCVLIATIVVPSDFVIPDFGYFNDVITCAEPIAQLSFVPFANMIYTDVYWELPDQSIVPGPNLNSGLPGVHQLHAVGPNGCIGTRYISIPFDTLPPFVLVETDSIGCNDTVQITAQSLDPNITYQWSGTGIINSALNVANANLPGTYHLLATGVNGCNVSVDIQVDSNFVPPVFSLLADSLRCDQPATLTAIPQSAVLQYQWFDAADNLIGTGSTVDVMNPGQYTIEVTGVNRCTARDTLTLVPVTFPQIDIISDTLSCEMPTALLQSQIDIQPMSIIWLDEIGDTISVLDQTTVTREGPFYLLVTGPNGCLTRDTILVPYDTLRPNADIQQIGEIRCKERDVMLDGTNSTPATITYLWNNSGGMLLTDPTMPTVAVKDTGVYQLIVTSPDNGCMDTTYYKLSAASNEITGATFDIRKPVCSGEPNGSFTITSVMGGVDPFLYQLNGGSPQTGIVFSNLISDLYMITILDSAGCEYDTLLDIPFTADYTVDASPDIEINVGETVTLEGTTDLINTEISEIFWDSLGIALCTGCPSFDVSPWETTTYTFQVVSVTGCIISDQITVYVVKKGKFYIANIFSPNGDGINDEIRINAAPGISRVRQWVIFDRWGDAVYGKVDFDPADPSVFWDGRTSTGAFANPAVFPYLLEIELVNGFVELLHGNITLIR